MNVNELIDVEGVQQTVSGDLGLLAELVAIFQNELPGMQAALEFALAQGDAPALRAAAHRLKGSLCTLGLRCAHTAEQVEQAAGAGSLGIARDLVQQLQTELRDVVPALHCLLGS